MVQPRLVKLEKKIIRVMFEVCYVEIFRFLPFLYGARVTPRIHISAPETPNKGRFRLCNTVFDSIPPTWNEIIVESCNNPLLDPYLKMLNI